MALRIVFMGTPEFSVVTLKTLIAADHEICAVYSQPPRQAGRRGLELTRSPVHKAAEELGLEVRTPINFRDNETIAAFRDLQADVAVVVAYGLLLPESILTGTRHGAFNGHASLLPRWRGAAPIQRAIMQGDRQTGMMIMKMDKGLDTGPVALTERIDIGENETAGELHDRLSLIGGRLMVEAMDLLQKGRLELRPQDEDGVLYAAKIGKAETRIDIEQPALQVHKHICGLSPFPGAWFEVDYAGRSERIKVLSTCLAEGEGIAGTFLDDNLTLACKTGSIRLLRLQKAGGKVLESREFLRGMALGAGTRIN